MFISKLTSYVILISLLSSCAGDVALDKSNTITPKALAAESNTGSTIWDVVNSDSKTTPVKVNRYIWQASLDVLDFMPVETVDPFSGVIVMGYGRPPGGKIEYQATVFVSDPALDARTLRIALRTRNGPADAETMRALEDAVLNRARQFRENDAKF